MTVYVKPRKRCNICGELKLLGAFNRDKTKSQGRQSICVNCRKKLRRKTVRVQGSSIHSFLFPCALKEISANDLAWLVGWLEGEGCFGINTKRGYPFPRISGASTDRDTLERVQVITGVGTISEIKKQKVHHKQCWIWNVQRFLDALELMRVLEPHMMARRRQRIHEIMASVERVEHTEEVLV
jgi:hypothetical protein